MEIRIIISPVGFYYRSNRLLVGLYALVAVCTLNALFYVVLFYCRNECCH